MGVDDVAKGGVNVIRALIPPRTDSPAQNRWSWSVTLSLYSIMILGSIHVAWVCGWLTMFGINAPYAAAAEQQEYNHRVISVQKTELERDIRDAKSNLCLAIESKNQRALDAWARQLEALKSSYRDNIHEEPQVMGCDELLIVGTGG